MQLTDHETGVNSFEWGDASQLYFLAGDAETSASKDRKKRYGELTVVDEEYTMNHVWVVKPERRFVEKGGIVIEE